MIARKFFGALISAALMLTPASASLAQSTGYDPRAVPSGSPLATQQSQQSSDRRDRQEEDNRSATVDPGGSNRLIEPAEIDTDRDVIPNDRLEQYYNRSLLDETRLRKPAKPGEFEEYVKRVLGRTLPRFGASLLLPSQRDFATPATATVPPDYVLNVGDTVSIALTGSAEGSVDREIDTDGKIFLPKVGAIRLAGVRYRDLRDRVSAAIGQQYRGYTVTVGIKKLRGIRVYVTGFANNPGAFTVSSLSTIANAVFSAGGPNAGGSFRSIKLYRQGQEVADFDLYQLVRGGSRINDAVLQNEDVLFIPPAGPQVAVVGSVNEEAIYEARVGETMDNLVAYAGGPNSLGDPSRIIYYRTSDPRVVGAQQVSSQQAGTVTVAGGDIVQILSQGTLAQPTERQSVLVRIEGEVNRPGNYYFPPNTPINAAIAQAGGLTSRAFAFGTKFQRLSVRAQQRESYLEAIKQLELSLAATPLTTESTSAQDSSERDRQLNGARAVLERLRQAEPDGRVVLDIPSNANSLPGDILLESNDTIMIPPRASTIGVFGAVYRPASFLLPAGRPLKVSDYIERAGGTLRAADRGGVFVVRANGAVVSYKRGALNTRVLPGDVVFVPIKTQSSNFWARVRDISTILFQVGLSAATINAIK